MKIGFWIVGVSIALVVLFFFLRSLYFNRGYYVRFILPTGYRGLFKIKVDQTYDQESVKENEEYIFKIPPSGILILHDDFPLYKWHKVKAEYETGAQIEIEKNNTSPLTISFFALSTTDKKETYYLIGTRSEYDQFWKLSNMEREKYIGKKLIS